MTHPPEACHVATLTHWGGVERMLVDLLCHVGQVRVRHSLLTTSSDPDILAVVRAAGVPCFQPGGRFRYSPGKFVEMVRWMRSRQVQVVHSYNARSNLWGAVATRLAGTPVLITSEHGAAWSVAGPSARLDAWAHRQAKLVVANSQASATILHAKYGIPLRKIRVIYNGVPDIAGADFNAARASLGVSPDAVLVGSIGRLDTPKDFATLIESAALVTGARKDVYFVLVGGGPLERELRGLVAELQIQDRFLMTGRRADARLLLAGFDLFVSTSIRESFGNALIEAGLSGKPVIAPVVDGIPEAVIHEETGLLLTPSRRIRRSRSRDATPLPKRVLLENRLQPPKALEPRLLAETILRLLDDPDRAHKYGRQGRERARRLFTIERYADDLESLYLEAQAAEDKLV